MVLIFTCFKDSETICLVVFVAKKVLNIFFNIIMYIPELGSIQFWNLHISLMLNDCYMLRIIHHKVKVKTTLFFTLFKNFLVESKEIWVYLFYYIYLCYIEYSICMYIWVVQNIKPVHVGSQIYNFYIK